MTVSGIIEHLAQIWSQKSRGSRGFWKWLGYLLTLAAVVYLAYMLAKGNLSLRQVNWKIYGTSIAAALGVYLLSLVIQFFTWSRMISFHRKIDWQDINIYSRMILMRSLPGGAWHWIGRISMYSSATEVPTKVVVLGNFLEWILLILVGLAIWVGSIPFPVLPILGTLLLAGAAVWLAASWQPAERGWPRRLAEAGGWVILDGLVWGLGAVILYLFVRATGSGSSFQWVDSLRAWSLSGSLSMLIIVLPSSLGIREISLIALLQPVLSTSLALLVALMIRIVFTIADVFWGILGWLLSQVILRHLVSAQAAPD